jgi:drug/metabolite transporter (DMT)-like permease
MMVPIVLLVDKPWTLQFPSINVWAAVVAMGLLSTALAYVIYFRLLSSAGATNAQLVTFLVPVSAILLGTIFLSEQLNIRQIAGMGLISLGLMAIDGRLFRRIRARGSHRSGEQPSQVVD